MVSICISYGQNSQIQTIRFEKSLIPKNAYVFYVIGDWGRHGEYNQQEVANAMKQCALEAEPEFIISTGDNFYPYGVASINDPHWQKSFEDVYHWHDLHVMWYSILGNHDYYGSTKAQMDYSKISRRWSMPSAYFTFTKKTDANQSIRFIFTDTNPFVEKYRKKMDQYPDMAAQDTGRQMQWLDSVMNASDQAKEDWKIVIGHHPPYSGSGKHGDTKEMHGRFTTRFEKSKIDFYFSGHEHDLQHLRPAGSTVDYVISGAGSEVRPTEKKDFTQFAAAVPGFAIVSITPNEATFYFINTHTEIIYSYTRKR